MFSSNLKRPLLALALTAGLLAVAGPASADIVYNGHAGLGSASLKFDSNEWAEETFSIDIGNSETLSTSAKSDSNFTAVPEFGANANAFRPEVNDEVAVEGFSLGSNDKLEAAHAKEPLSFGLAFEHLS